jgi:two-component system, LytTR family, response regulator
MTPAPIRTLIVDDEQPARRKILAHLADYPEIEVAGEAGNGLEAVEAIRGIEPDLVFLDIQMPGMDGFEVLASVGTDAMPVTVFVTAYDEFALRAFEVEAVDYLLKPFDEERFSRALERAVRRVRSRAGDRQPMSQLLEKVRPGSAWLQRIVVRDEGKLFFVAVTDVLRFSAEQNYVRLHTRTGPFLIRETLNRLEARLDPERFARVHRSEIVNIDQISELQPWSHGDYRIVLKDATRLRLSRRYQHGFLERFH